MNKYFMCISNCNYYSYLSNFTYPSVVGFFRRMLGRGDDPCAGVLELELWPCVCTTVVEAGAVLNVLLIGLAIMVAPSANTTSKIK